MAVPLGEAEVAKAAVVRRERVEGVILPAVRPGLLGVVVPALIPTTR